MFILNSTLALFRLVTLFSNVKKIIDFHKTLFIVDLRNAEGRPERVILNSKKAIYKVEVFLFKIHRLFKHRCTDMKLLYGEFSVTYSEAVQNISRNQSFVQKLETLADEDNQCMFQLCELYQKYGKNRF